MGFDDSQQALLQVLVKEKCDSSNNPLWSNRSSKLRLRSTTRCRRVSMKRRARLDRSTRPGFSTVGRKVRILKKLVPNCESVGVEGLFRETADYIVALQMRVKLMQNMVELLSGSDHDHDE